MYVNAVKPHIIGIPAPSENNKLKFNAAIISIYGTLKVVGGGPWKLAHREKTEVGVAFLQDPWAFPRGPHWQRWWYPAHDQRVSQVLC